jgi:hypothetical protein
MSIKFCVVLQGRLSAESRAANGEKHATSRSAEKSRGWAVTRTATGFQRLRRWVDVYVIFLFLVEPTRLQLKDFSFNFKKRHINRDIEILVTKTNFDRVKQKLGPSGLCEGHLQNRLMLRHVLVLVTRGR